MKLQEITDYKVMTAKECIDALGWSYTQKGPSFEDITCTCGKLVQISGYIGVEILECPECGKHMVNLFSPIPVSSGTCAVLSPEVYEVEDNRYWIAVDGKGGIKL